MPIESINTISNIVVKNESDPWITIEKDTLKETFTQEEIDTIIVPFFNFLWALPGYVESINTTSASENKKITNLVFDSYENMMSAINVLYGPNANPVVVAKNNLLNEKIQQAGAVYTRTRFFISTTLTTP